MDETVINDISDDGVGRVVYAPDYSSTAKGLRVIPDSGSSAKDVCGLYRYSPKADDTRLVEFMEFAKNEPESTDDIQEMADNMHLSELDETAEWLSGALSAILKARAVKMRKKYGLSS